MKVQIKNESRSLIVIKEQGNKEPVYLYPMQETIMEENNLSLETKKQISRGILTVKKVRIPSKKEEMKQEVKKADKK